MKNFSLIILAFLALSLTVIHCSDYDFNNPYDSRNLGSGGGVVYYCPTACAAVFGASVPSGCFFSRTDCEASQDVDNPNNVNYFCPVAGCVRQGGASTPANCFATITDCWAAPLPDPFNSSVVYGTLIDHRDNKTYRTVQMPDGNEWMAENLNYRDSDWSHNDVAGFVSVGDKGSWCYDDNTNNCDKYGRLYTWAAAMEACPPDWHLPSDTDWAGLIAVVVGAGGNSSDAAIKLKSAVGWATHSTVSIATNEYGFSALPGGSRSYSSYNSIFENGYWWTDTESNTSGSPLVRVMSYDNSLILSMGIYVGNDGLSVRCVKD